MSVKFVERNLCAGRPVKDVIAVARVPLGALPAFEETGLLGRDCPVIAADRYGQLWSLVARVHRCEIDRIKGDVELRALGVGTPERVFAAPA